MSNAATLTPTSILAERVAADLQLPPRGVLATITLIEEGATIPFIARYRKEATGELNEEHIEKISERRLYLLDLESRRAAIIKEIAEQKKLTPELRAMLEAAQTKQELEDLYLPYKKRRRTKAQMARERGLEPLAEAILSGEVTDLQAFAASFVDAAKEVPDVAAAIDGAKHIIAEEVAHNADVRNMVRNAMWTRAKLRIEGGPDEAADKEGRFRDLHDYAQAVNNLPGHRILAANRGEREKALRVRVDVDTAPEATALKSGNIPKPHSEAGRTTADAIDDGFERLLVPSIEAEVRVDLTEQADTEAIEVFAENLRHLLLEAPLGPKAVLGVDPGFRTGCKLAVIGKSGELLAHDVMYPTAPKNDVANAALTIKRLHDKYKFEYAAVGNGTASRETEAFLRSLAQHGMKFTVVMVSESGASIYSASEVARKEFPDLDLTVRGAISIARRLQDPLAELVKLDPKSIGVGQYQHDVNQRQLKDALDRVVESCVNAVGVNVNTASVELLQYVSGIGPKLASAIVEHRTANGAFANRAALKNVSGLGAKAFELCAGFLRVPDGDNILDNTGVHPERYKLVSQMAKTAGVSIADLAGNRELVAKLDPTQFIAEAEGAGMPTIVDILDELRRPGRDPRGGFQAFEFADVHEMKDLHEGMVVPGIITNVTKFGAFVDVGVHQDGLVHISQLADKFVDDPAQVVHVGQKVKVRVVSVEIERKRIALSMKGVGGGG
ncbi:MAG: Tex family protein [Planctomycetota bacterium]